MNILAQWFAGVAGISMGLGFVGWLIKRYIDQRLSYAFKEKEQRLSHSLKADEQRFGTELRIKEKYEDYVREVFTREFPAINELVYRSGTMVRDAPTNPDCIYLDELQNLWSDLAEKLYGLQIFLPRQCSTSYTRTSDNSKLRSYTLTRVLRMPLTSVLPEMILTALSLSTI